jgi:hypothetical protein
MNKFTLSLALVSALSFGCSSTSHSGGSAEASMEEMMAAWQRAATTGEEHRALDAFLGTWKATVTVYWSPDAPPDVSTGTMTNTWVLDGRHLEQRYDGFAGGEPFKGLGTWGFDIAAGEYYGTWIDSMGTAIMLSTGPRSADGKTFKLTSVNTDPVSGKRVPSEEVIVIESPSRHTMTSYKLDGKKRTKWMEIIYERAL